MRQVSIRALRANLAREFKDLPFEVMVSGKVVAMCTQPELTAYTSDEKAALSVHKVEKTDKKRVHKDKNEGKCVHSQSDGTEQNQIVASVYTCKSDISPPVGDWRSRRVAMPKGGR